MKIELDPREDKNGCLFHLGKLSFPGEINCSNGVTFLIFLSEEGDEELQIATINNENTTFSKYSKRDDRVKVSLEGRIDKYGKKFYVGKLMFKGIVDCNDGILFIIFTSKEGCEELQVVGNIHFDNGRGRPQKRFHQNNYLEDNYDRGNHRSPREDYQLDNYERGSSRGNYRGNRDDYQILARRNFNSPEDNSKY